MEERDSLAVGLWKTAIASYWYVLPAGHSSILCPAGNSCARLQVCEVLHLQCQPVLISVSIGMRNGDHLLADYLPPALNGSRRDKHKAGATESAGLSPALSLLATRRVAELLFQHSPELRELALAIQGAHVPTDEGLLSLTKGQ